MPDVWSNVASLDDTAQERLGTVLETRGADPQQRALRMEHLRELVVPKAARMLDVGCGTGTSTRALAAIPQAGSVTGVDPAPSLLEIARERSAGLRNISFEQGAASALQFGDAEFDVVSFDSVLSHVPEPEQALREAYRVMQPGGWLAVFDGDYATTTVALGPLDPLQTCVDAMLANSVTDRWVMRRSGEMAERCGFDAISVRSHGFIERAPAAYMRTIVERGIDILNAEGVLSEESASGLRVELQQRIDHSTFFGHIAYVSLLARKSIA